MGLLKNFPFLKKLSFTTIIIIYFIYAQVKCNGNSTYNKDIDDLCWSGLECNSTCCSFNKCANTSVCENFIIPKIDIPEKIYSSSTYNKAYNKNINDSCSSNLECYSACCSSNKCAKTSKCKNLVKAVYIAEAALCLVFNIAFTIYLIIKLKKIKEDFQKKTSSPEEEQKKQN